MTRAWAMCAVLAAGCVTEAPPAPLSEFVELQMPAIEIPAGTERMYCYFVDIEDGDLAIDLVEGEQGPGGHHLGLKVSPHRRPNRTIEECTSNEANLDLHDLHFGGNLLPDGAMLIPDGTQLIIQAHYLNATDAPLTVRDRVRLRRHTVTERTRWMSALHFADDQVAVEPGRTTRTFSCAPEVETELLVWWGHMHGYGERFTIAKGAAMLYDHAWQPGFEAEPPRLPIEPASSVVRPDTPLTIMCAWNNTSSSAIAFPHEMCGVGGYVLGTTPFFCGGDR